MNKMDKKEAKALIAKFTRNLPLSAMGLCYLFESCLLYTSPSPRD